jgi:hypothetical protein
MAQSLSSKELKLKLHLFLKGFKPALLIIITDISLSLYQLYNALLAA